MVLFFCPLSLMYSRLFIIKNTKWKMSSSLEKSSLSINIFFNVHLKKMIAKTIEMWWLLNRTVRYECISDEYIIEPVQMHPLHCEDIQPHAYLSYINPTRLIWNERWKARVRQDSVLACYILVLSALLFLLFVTTAHVCDLISLDNDFLFVTSKTTKSLASIFRFHYIFII